MYLTALTQRDRLFETATRWLIGDVRPSDAWFVTGVFLIDHLITRPVVVDLLSDVVGRVGRADVVHVRTKDELRRRMISAWRRPTPRGQELFSSYERSSARFFPMTRIDGFVLEEPSLDMAATIRFKSLPRIVEKSTRLARDRITTEMQKFGQGRTDAPAEEWSRLEQQVCEAIENRRLAFETCDMAVQDVIGVKLVAPDHRLDEVEQVLCDRGGSAIVQRQEHRGRYNDRQLIVRLPAPSAGPTIDRLRSIDWSAASSRGMRPEDLLRAIPSYVESGSDSVSIEIILTNWEDYVESEFGLSMHEERVVRQRSHDHPGSHVATSIALGLSYLLLVAISPTVEIYQTPIRLSGRYLPETTVGMIAQLFGIEIATSPFWTEDTVVGLALKPANTTSA